MATVLIVAPVFALIALGYVAVRAGFVSESANKGISEFAFSIAIPALLFRTVVISEFPAVSAFEVWGAFYGALALTWIAALLLSSLLRQKREDGVVFAIGAVYGNIVMLGIPLTLSALGNQAAGPMALILSVNTPLLWLFGTLQMAWTERKEPGSAASLILTILLDLARNPIMLAIGLGLVWRFTGFGLTPTVCTPSMLPDVDDDLLRLDRQVCFALAVAARNVIALFHSLACPRTTASSRRSASF